MLKSSTNRAKVKPIELGCAGHFIGAASCRWRRHTQVGRFRISTVGDYYGFGGQRSTLGAGENDWFETMVFKTTTRPDPGSKKCGCRAVSDWGGLECRRYGTAGEAQAGHERLIAKYRRISNGR